MLNLIVLIFSDPMPEMPGPPPPPGEGLLPPGLQDGSMPPGL